MKITIAIILVNIESGGTKRHVEEMSKSWTLEGYNVILVEVYGRLIQVNLLEKTKKKFLCNIFNDIGLKQLKSIFKYFNVGLLHVHHLLDANISFFKIHKDLNIPLVITLHDYYCICPFIKLTNEKEEYCKELGINECNRCLLKRKFYSKHLDMQINNIDIWRDFWFNYLKEASQIVVPSCDMKIRIQKYYPSLNLSVFENPELINFNTNIRRIGLIGDLSVPKGAKKIKECIEYVTKNKLPLYFIVFGKLNNIKLTKEEKKYISILGTYKEEEVYINIKKFCIDFFWFPGVWPETYSYTLSIPIRLRIPCISTDLGAIAYRIKQNNWGEIYDWTFDTEKIIGLLMNFNYEKYYNKDFIIKNISFGEIDRYYININLDVPSKINEKIDIRYFPELKTNLSGVEFKYLWKNANFIQKIKLIFYLDKQVIKKKLYKFLFR